VKKKTCIAKVDRIEKRYGASRITTKGHDLQPTRSYLWLYGVSRKVQDQAQEVNKVTRRRSSVEART
jgi:hypothetical protein